MNTASRMESTGIKNRVQLSPTTADEIVQRGYKSFIVEAREDLVEAKGKGTIQTYWLLPNAAASMKSFAPSTDDDASTGGLVSVGSIERGGDEDISRGSIDMAVDKDIEC